MNLPNKLTLMRVLLIPVIIVVGLIEALDVVMFQGTNISIASFIIFIIFSIASFTDFLDGYIARKYNLVTDFGKFVDPLADKMLVVSTLIVIFNLSLLTGYKVVLFLIAVILIIVREFFVSGIRMVAASNNKVIQASNMGKIKTVLQMAMIIFILLGNYPFSLINFDFDTVLIVAALIMTVISAVDYFIKNKDTVFNTEERK
ncbi:MAG: CDP-diacylglycerol--glycerol-3-phosphate 3-phosphatidyltransferase [Bacilli bacterium]|nr:CDP-diacylglycerol--glycerol-3-phosphate 3-phosphatidyltransferase [Bacilli bacterium]